MDKWQNVADAIQWEHIVPASPMPARAFDCWALGGREKCEREDPRAQGMLFDLHNLAPLTGDEDLDQMGLRTQSNHQNLPVRRLRR